jgi:hypothetical protein
LTDRAGRAAEPVDEHEFLPERTLDVVALLHVDPGGPAGRDERAQPGGRRRAVLAHDETMHRTGLPDDARPVDHDRDVAQAAADVLRADPLAQDIIFGDAVL